MFLFKQETNYTILNWLKTKEGKNLVNKIYNKYFSKNVRNPFCYYKWCWAIAFDNRLILDTDDSEAEETPIDSDSTKIKIFTDNEQLNNPRIVKDIAKISLIADISGHGIDSEGSFFDNDVMMYMAAQQALLGKAFIDTNDLSITPYSQDNVIKAITFPGSPEAIYGLSIDQIKKILNS